MYKLTPLFLMAVFVGLSLLGRPLESLASSADGPSRWSGSISIGAGLSGLKDDDPTHLMMHENLGLFGGYRFGRFVFGPVFELRMMQQLSALSTVGGTNFTGTGTYAGLGLRYDLNAKWSVQTDFLFAGEYRFGRQTYASEDARLTRPIGVSIKPQYFYFPEKPYSLDLDLRFLRWANFITPNGQSLKSVTEVGLGLIFTFHFPTREPLATLPPKQPPPPEKPRSPEPQSQKISLAGSLFKTGSADLDDEAAYEQLAKAGRILAANPKLHVRIEGHTDSVGTEEKNQVLSQARADRIKAILVEGGVSADRITTQGFGASKPIADNKTKEGRAKNRRVEIHLDEK